MTNLAASVRQRLLNEAKRRAESLDYVASLYARERFLARLGQSPHRQRLTLKGATVFALWVDVHRPTRDLDFLGSGDLDLAEAVALIRDIIAIRSEDGLEFNQATVSAEAIRKSDAYAGIRVHASATLDSMRIRLQIDIGLGDVVTPPAQVADLPTILDGFPSPKVKVYPPETIVAEKLHAMVKLGIANSRMKDFYDVFVLASKREFGEELLTNAIQRTFRRRKTPIPQEPFALSEDFYADRQKQSQWRAFLVKTGVDAPKELAIVGGELRKFLVPVLEAARSGISERRAWRTGKWRRP